jgi:uncharacterized membrane protein YfcA
VDFTIVFFGFLVGGLVGLTGMGGGSLMAPVLILIFGVQPVTAVGTDLAYGAVTKTVGGWRHWRYKTVDLRLSTWMALGSVPSAIAGVITLQILHQDLGKTFDNVVLVAVAGALVLTAVTVTIRIVAFPHLSELERHDFRATTRDKVWAVVIGALVGFVLGVTSAGSGSLIAVGLIMVFRLVPRRVVGTDVFHAAILLWAAALAHLVAGNIDFGLAGTILLGSIPGVVTGSRYSARVPQDTLRLALCLVLVGAALGLVSKAGVSMPTPVIAAIPLVVIALIAWSQTRERRRGTSSPAMPARLATGSAGVE